MISESQAPDGFVKLEFYCARILQMIHNLNIDPAKTVPASLHDMLLDFSGEAQPPMSLEDTEALLDSILR